VLVSGGGESQDVVVVEVTQEVNGKMLTLLQDQRRERAWHAREAR